MAKDLSVDLRRRLVHDPLGTVGGGGVAIEHRTSGVATIALTGSMSTAI